MKVLYLTPWYPDKRDAMAGLFVQKHAEAVREQGVDVRVIHSQGWLDTLSQWRELKKTWGLPDVVQLNVIQKQGVLALWLKRLYGIPYVIVEHWTGYLPENSCVRSTGWHTRLMRRICSEAETVMPVSAHLQRAMQTLGFQAKRWQVINNVVEDFFFKKVERGKSKEKSTKTLLHISCVDEAHKNIKGILRAVKQISEHRQDFTLNIVGVSIDHEQVRSYAHELDIPDKMINWAGELTPAQVSEMFDQADIFVLNSNYENAPVVISESLAKGVPIISTDVGGIPEMVSGHSGILISPRDDKSLTQAIEQMLDHHEDYDHDRIRMDGKQYSYAAVGGGLKQIYEQAYASRQAK